MMDKDMLKTLIQSTGLPEHLIRAEIEMLLQKAGLSKDQVTLEDLREILARYLQDVLLEVKSESSFD